MIKNGPEPLSLQQRRVGRGTHSFPNRIANGCPRKGKGHWQHRNCCYTLTVTTTYMGTLLSKHRSSVPSPPDQNRCFNITQAPKSLWNFLSWKPPTTGQVSQYFSRNNQKTRPVIAVVIQCYSYKRQEKNYSRFTAMLPGFVLVASLPTSAVITENCTSVLQKDNKRYTSVGLNVFSSQRNQMSFGSDTLNNKWFR